jgi:uncharacterized membrane protein YfcA
MSHMRTRLPPSQTFDVALVMGGGTLAGVLGALLGLGGGVFLVPLLTLGLALPFRQAVAISLLSVIATSSMVAARVYSGHMGHSSFRGQNTVLPMSREGQACRVRKSER